MITSLDVDSVTDALKRTDLPDDVRRVLELRQLTASASVKKLYAMEHQASRDDRLRNLIVHHGARTGRPTAQGPQPLNLPKDGPKLVWCASCDRPAVLTPLCPWCGALGTPDRRASWSWKMVDHVMEVMATRSLAMVERFFGDALLAISGCVRGLFQAGPGNELIASDYSSIEAVVGAMLTGEQWRIDAFRNKQDIYLIGASKITGTPVQFYLDYFAQHGVHHSDRQKIGKVSDLAGLFGGWINSYKAFGSEEPDDVIKAQIIAWRAASPCIVEFWGGQWRGPPWRRERAELFGMEGHAIMAIQQPGQSFTFRGIGFRFDSEADKMLITLPSGRDLTYHSPRLAQSDRNTDELSISYTTNNSNPKYGGMGWVRMSTFGGRLTENVVQAVAHDIQRYGIINLRAAGYPVVLHVYDENVAEVPIGYGSIEEFERIMGTMPDWCADWPIRAEGGYRSIRYRKG